MSVRVAELHALGDATLQPASPGATSNATAANRSSIFAPMTGRELRMQRRAQQGCNNAAEVRNIRNPGVASKSATTAPLPPPLNATQAEAAELRELIPLAFPGINDADSAEVLALACGDPEAALMSFRALAQEAHDQGIWEGHGQA